MPGDERVRLFVALDIPGSVREALAQLRGDFETQFQKLCPGVRWVSLAAAHVTLKFIGEVSPEKSQQIRAALRDAFSMEPGGPIPLRFAGLGFFPNPRRPSLLWAGVETSPALAALARAVDDRLVPLGIPAETRAFRPHITLARFKSLEHIARLREAVERRAAAVFGESVAGDFHLYRSILKSSGAEYTRLDTYPLSRERAS